MAVKKDDNDDLEKIKEAVSGGEDKKEDEPKLTDLPGVGPAVAAKLEAAGIYDLMSLAVASPSELGEVAGVSPAVARKIIQASRGMLKLGFMDGMEFAESRSSVINITTGSKNLDNLLGGRELRAGQ